MKKTCPLFCNTKKCFRILFILFFGAVLFFPSGMAGAKDDIKIVLPLVVKNDLNSIIVGAMELAKQLNGKPLPVEGLDFDLDPETEKNILKLHSTINSLVIRYGLIQTPALSAGAPNNTIQCRVGCTGSQGCSATGTCTGNAWYKDSDGNCQTATCTVKCPACDGSSRLNISQDPLQGSGPVISPDR